MADPANTGCGSTLTLVISVAFTVNSPADVPAL